MGGKATNNRDRKVLFNHQQRYGVSRKECEVKEDVFLHFICLFVFIPELLEYVSVLMQIILLDHAEGRRVRMRPRSWKRRKGMESDPHVC